MTSRSDQIARTLTAFFEDFGVSDRTVKAAARRMNISESVASSAARAYEGADPTRERLIHESAGRLAERASAAERDLTKASIAELEALTAIQILRT